MSEELTGEVLIYRRDDGSPAIEVKLEGDTLWLSQQQIAQLFQTSRTNVIEHLRNIYDEGELQVESTCRKIRQVRTYRLRKPDWPILAMDAPILQCVSTISHAQVEYDKYSARLVEDPSDVEVAYLETIKDAQKEIEEKK